MSTPILSATALSVGHGGEALLRGIALDLPRGGLVAVLGANGIGKSTLLRTLAGLQVPVDGHVMLEGRDLHAMAPMDRARLVSVVLSGRPSVGLLDVRTLVGLGRQPWTGAFGRHGAADDRIMDEALERVGVTALQERAVQELSDGEMQLVMIARALAQDTPLLMLDEPTAFLDVTNRVKLMQVLRSIATGKERTVLFSTHDLQLALEVSDQLLLIDRGHQLWQGTPDEALSQGVLERAFAREGLLFDPVSRSFRIPR